jgi:pimeloyl-ACP methyl ester carboxylesterase
MRVVFVHGAFVRDGAWWWAPAARLLSQRGIASTAVALPSCGEAGARAARAARVVELATGHHPFLSRPDLVAAAIESAAGA